MWEITEQKLKAAAKFLDEIPSGLPGKGTSNEEYWRQFIRAIPYKLYTQQQIESFADELLGVTGSPSLKLLLDLRQRGFSYEQFLDCLEKIKCYKALNLFVQSTVPIINVDPQPQSVRIGSTIVLHCAAECTPPPPHYQWYWGDTPLRNQRSSRLEIYKADVQNAGVYKCKVTNPRIVDPKHNHSWSNLAKVEILKFPIQETVIHKSVRSVTETDTPSLRSESGTSITARGGIFAGDIEIVKQPVNTECRFDEQFRLHCEAKSKSGKHLSYTWKREKPGRVTVMHTETGTSSTLTSSWKKHDTLVIYCEVKHADGSSEEVVTTDKVKVTVHSIWFEEQPIDIDGFIGESALLYCKAAGKGQIHYLWLRSEQPDGKKEMIPNVAFTEDGIFEFGSLGQKDWGYYTCQAQNSDDFISSNTVRVQFQPKNQENLCIKVEPESYVTARGHSLQLVCKALPKQGTEYQWYHDGIPVRDGIEDTLILSNITDSDFGKYKCSIRNGGQTKQSKEVRVVLGSYIETARMNSTQSDQIEAEHTFKFKSQDDGSHDILYAREKIALLIANQNYECRDIKSLNSPHNDVKLLKEQLETMGFKVFAFLDLRFTEVMGVLEKICLKLDAGMYVLLYYSGHGFQHQNVDYIMPVDASFPIHCNSCISVDYITYRFQKTKSKVFVFFDCCRVNYESDKVVCPSSTSPGNQNIGYANLYKILSCSASNPAYERITDTCSVFNRALRKAFEERKSAEQLGSYVIKDMQDNGQTKNGKEFQRPVIMQQLGSLEITLHEDVMKDTWMRGTQVEEIHTNIQEPPRDISIQAADFKGLLFGKITFNFIVSNTLIVKIILKNVKKARYEFIVSTDQLESQGLCVERNVDGTEIKIVGLQRLKDQKLELIFHIKAITEDDKVTNQYPVNHSLYKLM